MEDHLAAGRALVPEIVRHVGLARPARGSSGGRNWSASSCGSVLRIHALPRAARRRRRGRAPAPARLGKRRASALPTRRRACVGDAADQRRADHGGVGDLARSAAACSGVLMPKPTATGRSVWRFSRATAAATSALAGRARAGDAGDRDVVDEARGVAQHRRQALVVGGRRRQADEVEPGLQRRQAQLLVLLRRQIDDDQAVDAGGLRVGEEAVDAIADRSGCSSPSGRSACRRRRRGSRAPAASVFFSVMPALQRAQARGLDRRAVGHRIGEGHAELDQVGAGGGQAAPGPATARSSGSPAVTKVTRPARPSPPSARRSGARCGSRSSSIRAHSLVPRCSATVKMSLSPRPHRFITSR